MTTITEDKVREMIENASKAELEIIWIPQIMRNQTTYEIQVNGTTEFNCIGLNAFDGKVITKYYKIVKSGRHLTDEQVEITKRKLVKYARQYVVLAQEQQQRQQRGQEVSA
jgi:hypothetical protein